jgi:hypothetical protein
VKIVLRQHPAHVIAPIDAADALALRRWYDNSATEEEKQAALGVIKSVHSKNGWIACDCLRGPKQPLLAPRRDPHAYTLIRMSRADGDPRARSDRPNHADECPFHYNQEYGGKGTGSKFLARAFPVKNAAYFDGLPAFADRLAEHDISAPLREPARSETPCALAIQLWRLLDGAGLNVILPLQDQNTPPKLSQQMRRIKEYAKTVKVLRSWRLSNLLSTWANDCLDDQSYWQQNFRKSKPDWPRSQRPTAFMTIFARDIAETKIYPAASAQFIDVAARIRHPLRGDPKRRGPFLVIVNFDDGEENGGPLRAVQAYAQPVHSGDTLYPVESRFECSVFELLLWAQATLAKAAPFIKIAVVKPLFAVTINQGPRQPDFVLEISILDRPMTRLVIEAMGFETPAYVPKIDSIGPVFELRPSQIIEQTISATRKRLLDWILRNSHR